MNAVSVAAGALGAFAAGALAAGALAEVSAEVSAAAAGAALLSFCFAERTWRVRGRLPRLAHVGTALLAGGAAGWLTASYATADPLVALVVLVVAAVLAGMPLWIEADDPVAHALDGLGASVGEPAKSSLFEGAQLRRGTDPSLLDRATRDGVRKTWRNLLVLARTRARLEHTSAARIAFANTARAGASVPVAVMVTEPTACCANDALSTTEPLSQQRALEAAGVNPPMDSELPTSTSTVGEELAASEDTVASEETAVGKNTAPALARTSQLLPRSHRRAVLARLDARIAEHVATLARAYTAADTAHAAEVSLDDGALRAVETTGESLEQMTEAICDEI